MALSGQDRGTGNHNSSVTTLGIRSTTNFSGTSGAMAVFCMSLDNARSGGAAYDAATFLVSDSAGNTWTGRLFPINDPGAANAGVAGAIFTAPIVSAITTATTITIGLGTASTAKAWTLSEAVPDSGWRVVYVTGANGTAATTTTPSITTTSIASGNLVLGGLFNEHGTAQTATGDADATNGSWSTQQTNEIGTTAAGQTITTQYKIVTTGATQTYNPTLGVSSDLVLSWIELTELRNVRDIIGAGPIPWHRP